MDQIVDYQENDWRELYSDGSCLDPGDENIAVASWGSHTRSHGTFCGPGAGTQTAQAGEVEAALQAAMVAATGATLYTDNKYVTGVITGERTTWDGAKAPKPANGKSSG